MNGLVVHQEQEFLLFLDADMQRKVQWMLHKSDQLDVLEQGAVS